MKLYLTKGMVLQLSKFKNFLNAHFNFFSILISK
jgi:hypothetical protein